MAAMSIHSPASSQPPAGLADVLNPADENRDSAYFSSSSNGDASKHTSMASCNNQGLTPSSGYQSSVADKTPSPISTTSLTVPALSSPISSGMTVASMVSPTTPSSMDATMLAKLGPQYEVTHRYSTASNSDSVSRRESVESRINTGFEGMKLSGNSPYASNNQSTTSIQSALQQQRSPVSADRLSASRFANSYQPNSQRFGNEHPKSRTAPVITAPATSAVAHAAEPTKGQPWAFPLEPIQRVPQSQPMVTDTGSRQTSFIGSRRSSIADSLASSQYTTESRLPHGQRRLEDGYSNDYSRLSRASSEFQGAAHHHHSLQHKQLDELRDEDAGSPGGGQPYSRTPELRVSHKLAERKRRNEMKELYDELRELMPQDRGAKASKWEILRRAIEEHKRHDNVIRELSHNYNLARVELEKNHEEMAELRQELRQMKQELAQYMHGGHHNQAAPPQVAQEQYPTDPFGRGYPPRPEHRMDLPLPPLRSLNNGPISPAPESMTGVQYHHETSAAPRYRFPAGI